MRKKLLLLVTAVAMLLSSVGLTAFAATATTTATVMAYNSSNTQTYSGSDLASAISAAGTDGRVVIGEGTIALASRIGVSQSGITIEGAGIGKTIIKPNDTDAYRTSIKGGSSNCKALIGVTGSNVTIKNMTIDGSGIQGTYNLIKTYDFVPLRLNGSASTATVIIENIKIVKNNETGAKGFIQIGTNSTDSAAVTARNVYLEGNSYSTTYADIDFGSCEGSSLTVEGGAFHGVITSGTTHTVTFSGNGYYSTNVSLLGSSYVLYTTIPYVVDLYNSGDSSLWSSYMDVLQENADSGEVLVKDMTDDLTDDTVSLYGKTCDEKKVLASEFKAALTGFSNTDDTFKTAAAAYITSLETALADTDWHTWTEGTVSNYERTDTCSVCGAANKVELEVPDVDVSQNEDITVEDTNGPVEVTDDVKEIISTVIQNSAVNSFENTNIANATGIERATMKIALQSAKLDGEVVKSMTFDVKPVKADGSVIGNGSIASAITFRLPVDKNASETKAKVSHNGAALSGYYDVQTENGEKFIEISASEFSTYSYELVEPTYEAAIGEAKYETLQAALDAAADGDEITLLTYIDMTQAIKIEKVITFDLNGNTLKLAPTDNYGIVVKNSLTINDSSEDESGVILVTGLYGIGTSTSCTGGLTVNGGTIKPEGENYYLIGAFGGTVTINGGKFEADYCAVNSFADYSATVKITDGVFTATNTTDETSATLLGINIEVTGGSYDDDVTEYCADGFVASKNSDGTYSIVEEAEALTTKRLTVVDMPKTESEKYQVGCFAAIGSIEYNGMGIRVTADNGAFTKDITLTELYNSLIVGEKTYTAEDFGLEGGYIFGTVIEVDENYTDFRFQPYALKGGNTVNGSWSTEQTVSAAE